MQDDIDQKSIAFVINNGKFTGRMLERIALHYLGEAKKLEQDLKHPPHKQGKQSLKRLGKQNQGMTNIKLSNDNIKAFERHAKKYGVDFALKKDKSTDPPKYFVFFKGRDEDSIKSALKDFTQAMAKKKKKPSVKKQLQQLKTKRKTRKVARQLVKNFNRNSRGGGLVP